MNKDVLTAVPSMAYTDTPVLTAELELTTPVVTVATEEFEVDQDEPVLTVSAELEDDLPNFVFSAS